MTVLISGAGVAGLTLGLSLHQVGIPFRIIEAIAELRPLGFGINLQPHAVRELYDLGLEEKMDRIGLRTGKTSYFNSQGQEIWSEARGLEAGYAYPQYSVHRGALQMMLHETLLERCGPKAILAGAKVSEWLETPRGLEVILTDRQYGFELDRMRGSVLIASDGARSETRQTLFPDVGGPNRRNSMMWRGVARSQRFLDGRTMTISGTKGQKFVAYPIGDRGKTQSFVHWIADLANAPERDYDTQGWGRKGSIDDVLPSFGDWRFDWLDIPALIGGTEAVWEWPMVDRDPLPSWTEGRIALLGDSAHPMYPIGSNGASQGILDARVMARSLRDHGETTLALQDYDADRREAVNAIILANRTQGPDAILDRVADLAPDGFDDIDAVMPEADRRAISDRYKEATGLTVEEVNAQPSIIGPMGDQPNYTGPLKD
ncbi:2-polyprenyl-6-methoxyphenol hydroxylase-like FAD-dependent oxidoreductase [Aliiruegeria haliotis]|uniref:2-polyprenyl-6-methoxyphenol hydroxylase-like FAD-dependent oxidoreductase n=1 Tax=Aliiruegeria haliotis TaxID=1280846 RepID=A0A2T0S051_9RHOB|nr:flavin-dependent oxidoreductase [Aliiruegeria haliotis]PRY26673.1 2-polyprenyl-6-methoxyphenol hydroxylase-like FAD-dependent oxidoreductase [Aliiruegeria haliotis]